MCARIRAVVATVEVAATREVPATVEVGETVPSTVEVAPTEVVGTTVPSTEVVAPTVGMYDCRALYSRSSLYSMYMCVLLEDHGRPWLALLWKGRVRRG